MPLHYGGSLNSHGRLSSMPSLAKNMRYNRRVAIEKLVRFDLSAANTSVVITDTELGVLLNMSKHRIAGLRKTADYLKLRIELTTGIMSDVGVQLEKTLEYRKAHFIESLPSAMRVITDILEAKPTSIQERTLQAKVALEFMDREGSFTKVTKADLTVRHEHDYSHADGVSAELLELMQATRKPATIQAQAANTQVMLDANTMFSNSETVTYDAQEESLKILEEFETDQKSVQ